DEEEDVRKLPVHGADEVALLRCGAAERQLRAADVVRDSRQDVLSEIGDRLLRGPGRAVVQAERLDEADVALVPGRRRGRTVQPRRLTQDARDLPEILRRDVATLCEHDVREIDAVRDAGRGDRVAPRFGVARAWLVLELSVAR